MKEIGERIVRISRTYKREMLLKLNKEVDGKYVDTMKTALGDRALKQGKLFYGRIWTKLQPKKRSAYVCRWNKLARL